MQEKNKRSKGTLFILITGVKTRSQININTNYLKVTEIWLYYILICFRITRVATGEVAPYLSPNLNKHRIFKAFTEKYPSSIVTYRYYRKVFDSDFPELKFERMTVDSCKMCDNLKAALTIATTKNYKKEAERDLELHHRKAQKVQDYMKDDLLRAQNPSVSTICMDLQQVMVVPILTDSSMFYSRQLSTYNLGLHIGDYDRYCFHVYVARRYQWKRRE